MDIIIFIFLKVVVSLLAVTVFAAPQNIGIVRQLQDIYPDGSYEYLYETENGIFAQEEGKVRKIEKDHVDLAVQGSFLYTSPEGKQIHLTYIADENGFQPQGEHLPTPPPIPPQIQKALEWLAAHPSEERR
ncbi:hypothetical protein NQ314_016171 [Rhamnusium bicolor]|uniref:Uncharacterized protein n=1 Tax=Rhamnusium bicolor TaxID=1586634 RepID=A0AAV8WWJ0_9CUCU|nr:hypothetical protein NQ314_016171 [Rhamnusium bicolor]